MRKATVFIRQLGARICISLPPGCATSTSSYPRWDEYLPSVYGTNNFKFNAIPTGFRTYSVGNFLGVGGFVNTWTSTVSSATRAYYISMDYRDNQVVTIATIPFSEGKSVRGVKEYSGTAEDGTVFTSGSNIYTDGEGNVYNTVKIGEQLWTTQPLYTVKYQNGDAIANVTNNTTWKDLTTGAYCWYDNDYSTYGQYYGALYNWYAVDNGLISGDGWSVPSNEAWEELINYIVGVNWCASVTTNNVARYLKSCRQVNHPLV